MKKAWKIISTVLVWLVVIVAVAMMIFTIVSVNTFDRNDRDIFGYRCYIVLSDSMSKTHFNAGDLVLIKNVDVTLLQPGDVIAYQSQNAENYGKTVTHMIKEKTFDAKGNPGFVTYGTTTGAVDETIVTYPFVLGQYAGKIPAMGKFFQFLKTPQGYIVCILIPFLLLILYQGLNCVKIFRRYRAEQLAELMAEKKKVEEDRKRSEEMMAQLLAMKEQITAQAAPAPQPAQPVQQPDVAAMMAELEALRAQVAGSKAPEQPAKEPELEDIIAEFADEGGEST